MEGWQKDHIISNLRELVENTVWNSSLSSELRSAGTFGIADIQSIDAKKEELKKSKRLYDLIVTRTNGYQVLMNALYRVSQSRVYDIFVEGVFEHGLAEMFVVLSNHPVPLKDIFTKEEVKEIGVLLTETLGKEESFNMVLKAMSEKNAYSLVNNGIPIVPPYYIPRLLSNQICIKKEIFKEDMEDVFVFKNIKRYRLDQILKPLGKISDTSRNQVIRITSRFIHLDEEIHWKDIRKAAKFPIHLIVFEEKEENFILECSEGNSTIMPEFVSRYQSNKNYYVSEDEFLQRQNQIPGSSGACICDKPGMGKTELLGNLALKTKVVHPDRLVVYMSFTQILQSYSVSKQNNNTSFEDVLNIIIGQVATSTVAEKLLTYYFQTPGKKLELFLDGFDELSPIDINWSKNFLRTLFGKSDIAKIYITSRPHHRQDLEITFGVIAYDMLPFSMEIQRDFLVSFWKSKIVEPNQPKLETLGTTCLHKLQENLRNKELLGTPLQCLFLAELYLEEAMNICTLDTQIDDKSIASALYI